MSYPTSVSVLYIYCSGQHKTSVDQKLGVSKWEEDWLQLFVLIGDNALIWEANSEDDDCVYLKQNLGEDYFNWYCYSI